MYFCRSHVYSPEVSVSDDMTGQFSLVPVVADTPIKYRRVSTTSSLLQQDNGVSYAYVIIGWLLL